MSRAPLSLARPSAAPTTTAAKAAAALLEEETKRLLLDVPMSLHRKLRVYAAEHDTTVKAIVLKALADAGFE